MRPAADYRFLRYVKFTDISFPFSTAAKCSPISEVTNGVSAVMTSSSAASVNPSRSKLRLADAIALLTMTSWVFWIMNRSLLKKRERLGSAC